jgi:hypothetical protein
MEHHRSYPCRPNAPSYPQLPPLIPDVNKLLPAAPGVPASPGSWTWTTPSFWKRGPWYRTCLRNLKASCDQSDPTTAYYVGLYILDLHGKNSGVDDPKHLVLLWWKWPPDKWTELRQGLSMNSFTQPISGILPNSPMNDTECTTAITFAEELISLGVLEPEPFPNVENFLAGLTQVLALTVQLGLICQPAICTPPSQCIKYCGFIYDTTDAPTLHIPTDVTRALSQLAYILCLNTNISCIGLVIAVGNLQGLVPPSPNNTGATFLCHVYNYLHAYRGGIMLPR